MYLAMNRFTVPVENAAEFEQRWLTRESRLHEMAGFVSFNMLKSGESEGTILYASHTVWETEGDFRAWTSSDVFRASHVRAGESRKLHEGMPRFEGFESIQQISAVQPA